MTSRWAAEPAGAAAAFGIVVPVCESADRTFKQIREANGSMSDQQTTLAELRELVERFVDARDWHQFHSPKNLSMALAIEAAELMEHFQWITTDASRAVGQQNEKLAAVGEELADVLCYTLALANELGIDLSDALRAKMEKNAAKYPVETYRGRYGPEDDSPPGDS